jgi:hypothetical protein
LQKEVVEAKTEVKKSKQETDRVLQLLKAAQEEKSTQQKLIEELQE